MRDQTLLLGVLGVVSVVAVALMVGLYAAAVLSYDSKVRNLEAPPIVLHGETFRGSIVLLRGYGILRPCVALTYESGTSWMAKAECFEDLPARAAGGLWLNEWRITRIEPTPAGQLVKVFVR